MPSFRMAVVPYQRGAPLNAEPTDQNGRVADDPPEPQEQPKRWWQRGAGWSLRRVLAAIAIVIFAIVAVQAIRVWAAFDPDRIDPDVEGARTRISQLTDAERPPEPPIDDPNETPTTPIPLPSTTEPVTTAPSASTTTPPASTSTSTTTTGPPDISGEQLPYDPEFSTSPPIPDEAFDAYLIIGTDRRAGLGGSRADVIMLALLPEDGSAPILVSIPRDLWLPNACWDRPRRVNVSLNGCGDAASGPELLAITVADFTGIQADHFALFDFEDFRRVIDAFGGIRICVDTPVRDERFEFPAGCSDLDGETALHWVRSRHTQEFVDGAWRTIRGVSDLTRNERQQDVLIQLLGKVRSLNTLTSLVDIVESISDAVTIDEGISVTDAIGLAWDLRTVAPGDIVRIEIPVQFHRTEGGASVLLPRMSFEEIFAPYWP